MMLENRPIFFVNLAISSFSACNDDTWFSDTSRRRAGNKSGLDWLVEEDVTNQVDHTETVRIHRHITITVDQSITIGTIYQEEKEK